MNDSTQAAPAPQEPKAGDWGGLAKRNLPTPPEPRSLEAFRRKNVAQLASRAIGPTFPLWHEQIDYIFADHGWQVRASRAWPFKASDHFPVTAELMWERSDAR
jgi:endonuclease/exonuclease/phosphatase family metal-dependent hydrolase